MATATEPAKWSMELGASADVSTIPDDSTGGELSMRSLFPAVTSLPLPAGGVAPSRKDMNGVLKLLGDFVWYAQHGGMATYDTGFDYAVGQCVSHSGSLWLCVAANGPSTSNVTAPGNDDTVWQRVPTESEIKSGITIFDLCPDGAAQHNALYRGKDITDMYDSGEYSENVADGSFKGIFPGDFIRKDRVIDGTTHTSPTIIGDCDYMFQFGDTPLARHHCLAFSGGALGTAYMNATNTTAGGFMASYMRTTVVPKLSAALRAAFGDSHILTFREFLTNAVNTSLAAPNRGWVGQASMSEWADSIAGIFCETMAYGSPNWGAGNYDRYVPPRQVSAFRHSPTLLNTDPDGNRFSWWLRDVCSSAAFAYVGGSGGAYVSYASVVFGVRPFCLIC